jgi:hypothetical protein
MVVCYVNETGEVRQIASSEVIKLAMAAVTATSHGLQPSDHMQSAARRLAQQVLKNCAANRDEFARGAAGISLLMVASVG